MDLDAFFRDFEEVLNMFPPTFVRDLVGTIIGAMPSLSGIDWMAIVAKLKPHALAAGVAYSAGMIDLNEVQAKGMAVMQRYFTANPPTV